MNTENKKTKFAYIDAEVHKALKIRSAETDTTVGKYINDILRQYVEDKLVLKRTAEEKHSLQWL